MQIDLNTLSKDELIKLKTNVEKALKTLDARRKADARKAADDAAKAFGFTFDELASETGKSSKGVAKYANPDNPAQTWTGRGRKPNWVIAWLDAGKSMTDLEL